MQSPLDKIRQKVSSNDEGGGITTSLYYLIKELGCLPDILGREYEVYDKDGNIIWRIKQKPISIPALNVLFKEMEKDYKRQEREMKKSQSRGRRR